MTESLGAFDDADTPPTPRALSAVLVPTSALWPRLLASLALGEKALPS